jgi:tetratricopeptide (TPR) repeat protein
MAAAQSQLEQLPATSATLMYSRGTVEPYVDVARGELLLRSGARDEGRAVLEQVQARIRAVPGPDAWMEALFRLEEIARLAREVGDWELAEYTAGQMREHDPAYAGTHFALARVAERKGDRAAAREGFARAVRYWSTADPDLPDLVEARAREAALASAAPSERLRAGR